MLFRGLSAAKVLSQWFEAERSRDAQGPGERPPPPREFQAHRAGMQVGTPARHPGPRVGLDDVPSRYQAKQAGLDRTLLAAYTGTHRGHTRDMPLGSHGHYIHESTVSAGLPCRPGTVLTRPPRLMRSRETNGAKGVQGYSCARVGGRAHGVSCGLSAAVA
jgi:hypothetical protein